VELIIHSEVIIEWKIFVQAQEKQEGGGGKIEMEMETTTLMSFLLMSLVMHRVVRVKLKNYIQRKNKKK
jgi:hypothetical protein